MGLGEWRARWRRGERRGRGGLVDGGDDDDLVSDAERRNHSLRDRAWPNGRAANAQRGHHGHHGHHGAGWFSSTWDLQAGLDVREGLPDDARPEETLMAWLLGRD